MKRILVTIACISLTFSGVVAFSTFRPAPARAQFGSNQVVVFVKDVSALTDGDHEITYDANEGGGNSVSNRTFTIDEPNSLDVGQLNDAIINDARIQLSAADHARIVIYGGPTREYVQGPQ